MAHRTRDFAGCLPGAVVRFPVTTDLHAEAQRLFDELIELDSDGRAARLNGMSGDPALTHEVSSLLAAAARAGDFLRVLSPEQVRVPRAGIIAGRYRI